MLTGTYILQTIRTKMYADEDAKCQLCKVETETLEHLLLDCTEPLNIRNPILRTDSGYIPSSYLCKIYMILNYKTVIIHVR
jgi:hypothetical protein